MREIHYIFPAELMKTVQSDIIIVVGDNVETSKTVPSIFYN